MTRQQHVVDDREFLLDCDGDTPTTILEEFCRALVARGRAPVPALLRQISQASADGDVLTTVDLSNKGLGDDYAVALARVLPRMPHVRGISLRDNRLSDDALDTVVRAAGDAAPARSTSRATTSARRPRVDPRCSRARLRAARLVLRTPTSTTSAARSSARWVCSLTKLDLAHNLIGQAESKNTVEPDLVTGGEAFADMLPVNVKLVARPLWNHLRDSAIAFRARCARTRRCATSRSRTTRSPRTPAELGLTLCTNKAHDRPLVQLGHARRVPRARQRAARQRRRSAPTPQPRRHPARPPWQPRSRTRARGQRDRAVDITMRNCEMTAEPDALFDTGEPSGVICLTWSCRSTARSRRARAAREHARRLRARAARAPPALKREQGEDARDYRARRG